MLWKPHIEPGARLKYLGIAEALEADIRTGALRAGDRLPPQRTVAEVLGVDLTTVTRAYNDARRRGLIEARSGQGTFVSHNVPMIGPGGVSSSGTRFDLSMNSPPQPAVADLVRRIPQSLASLLATSDGAATLHYQDPVGRDSDREIAATWLEPRLGPVALPRLLIGAGAQPVLFAICECLAKPGDGIAVSAHTYPGIKAIALQRGLRLIPLQADDGGILPKTFEESCRANSLKALYVVPTIDNPGTTTLNTERRKELAAIARRHDVQIIEDDPYGPLASQVLPAIASFAPELSWHVSTLSKCASPALRVAFVVAPSEREASRLAAILRATSLMASPLLSALTARWIDDGTLAKVTGAIRQENIERQKLAAIALKGADYSADPDGQHLWLRLPAEWRADEFAAHAGRSGLSIVPGSAFSVDTASGEERVRVSLGIAPDRSALGDALRLLAELLQQPSLATKAIV